LLLFLLAGAVTTTILGWILDSRIHANSNTVLPPPRAIWAEMDSRPPITLGAEETQWLANHGLKEWATTIRFRQEASELGKSETRYARTVEEYFGPSATVRVDIALPFVSFSGVVASSSVERIFPHPLVWPGFAINTIFYAAIVWMLFAVPGAVRRRLRHKRGQCASCGYSLRESTSHVCPECGATTIKQKAETQKA
jgi:predicted RNA-binding Zn-ribbon protein involved in translation (DUF1610 family)